MTTAVVLASAFAGAALTLVFTYYFRLRDQTATRAGALLIIRGELDFARTAIVASLERNELWPAWYRLEPPSWRDYRGELTTQLRPETWAEIDRAATRLGQLDRRAEELREEDRGVTDDFRAQLETVRDLISGPTAAEVSEGTNEAARNAAENAGDAAEVGDAGGGDDAGPRASRRPTHSALASEPRQA